MRRALSITIAWTALALCGASLSFGRYFLLEDELVFSNQPTGQDFTSIIYGGDHDTIYQGEFTFPNGSQELPSQASVAAKCAAVSGDVPSVAIDIESWPSGTQAERLATRDKIAQTIRWCVEANPALNGKVGFYGELPIGNYWDAVDCIPTPNDPGCLAWKAANDDMNFTPQLAAVGITPVLFPSNYIFYHEDPPYTNTINYTKARLQEAKRVCPACKIRPFIWPQFHEGGDMYGPIQTISTDTPAVLTTGYNDTAQDATSIQSGYEMRVYGKTATVSISIATPAVVTWNSHGLSAGMVVSFSTTGALPTGLSAGTLYYVRSPAGNTFQLSTDAAGSNVVNTSGSQSGTHTGRWGLSSHNPGQLYRVKRLSSTQFALYTLAGQAVNGATLAWPGGGSYRGEPPYGLWKAVLQANSDETDGAVIWGGWLQQWVKDSSWWKATKDFITGR